LTIRIGPRIWVERPRISQIFFSAQKLGCVRVTHQKASETCTPRVLVGIVVVDIITRDRVCVAGEQLCPYCATALDEIIKAAYRQLQEPE
jgi:hypothetical protein